MKHLPTPSAALKINWEKLGVIFDLINNGTVNGEAIVHFVTALGTNILINITIKKNIATNGIPEKGNEVNKVTNLHEITSPKFVHSNIPINCEVKNNKTNTYPKPSKST